MGHGSKRPQFNSRQAHVTAKTMGCMVRGGQDHIRWKFVYTPHPENIAVSSTGMNYECRGDQGRIICMGVTLTIAWDLLDHNDLIEIYASCCSGTVHSTAQVDIVIGNMYII